MVQIYQVSGVKETLAQFKALENKFGKEKIPGVSVGFSQAYAIYVHENMEASHPVGQAKYLEAAIGDQMKAVAGVISKTLINGGTLTQGLLLGGLLIQRSAQQRTPVKTGALKASAFTCETKDEEAEAQKAFQKGEQKRKQSKSK